MKLTSKKIALLCAVAGVSVGCSGEPSEEPQAEAPGDAAAVVAQTLDGLLNPNLAGEEELVALGVPAPVAAVVTAGRPYMDMEAVDAVLATEMDEATRQAFYARAWVPLNVNTASNEEILLIPGVGERMAHEFDEYRPYVAMEQFRREMGKYVDDAEVDRLAQYVFVPADLNTATREQIMALPGLGERMAHEFEEYRPYTNMEHFRREIGKYVDDAELDRLSRLVVIN